MTIYWVLKAAVIVSGVVVATLAAVGTAGWLVAAFGALATACETAVIAARLQSRAVIAGLLADGMAHEIRRFEMRRGPYASDDRAGILFDAIETLRASASATRFRLDGEVFAADAAAGSAGDRGEAGVGGQMPGRVGELRGRDDGPGGRVQAKAGERRCTRPGPASRRTS